MRRNRAATFVSCTLIASSAFDVAHSFSHRPGFATSTHHHHDVLAKSKSRRNSVPGIKLPRPTSTTCFLDLSSLATAPTVGTSTSAAQSIISPQALAASASAILTYISLLAYYDRPRGYLSIPDPQSSLVIQQSRVPGAGLGLYAARSLPAGTLLGSYAGVMRPMQTFYDGKCRQFPQAVGYSWRFTDSKYIIDPTDAQGEIQDFCVGGSSEVPLSNFFFGTFFSFLGVNTMLCRINEPPIGGGGCNVSAKENLDKREVVFTLIQDVVAGQELYLDYGLDYDRSMYGPR